MKKIISLVMALAMILGVCAISPVMADAAVTTSWTFADGVQGWQANRQSITGALSVDTDGNLVHNQLTTAENNFLLSPNNLGIDGSKYKYIKIVLKNEIATKGCVRLNFTSSKQTSFASTWPYAADNSITASATDFETYYIDMSENTTWTSDTISRVRIMASPYKAGADGNVLIKSIEFLESLPVEPISYVFADGVQGWQANRQAYTGALSVDTDGNLVYKQLAAYPQNFLISPNNLGIDGSKYKYIKIVLKNEIATKGCVRLNFTSSKQTSFASTWPYAADNSITASATDFETYYIDMSENTIWTSDTISRVRIMANPYTAGADGNVLVKSIEFVGEMDTVTPTATPTAAPTATPTAAPTATPTVAPTTAPTAEPVTDWIFAEDADTYDWQANQWDDAGNTSIDADGNLVFPQIAGVTNNFLVSPNNLNLDGSTYKYIRIVIKNPISNKGCLRVDFITEANKQDDGTYKYDGVWDYRADNVMTAGDTEFKEYIIDMTGTDWEGSTIKQMRIMANPYNPADTADIIVKSIELLTAIPESVTTVSEVQFDPNATETTGTLRFKAGISEKNFTAQKYGFKFVNFASDDDTISSYPSYSGDVTGTVTKSFDGDVEVNDVFYHDITDIPKEVNGTSVVGVGFYAVPFVYSETGTFHYGTPFTLDGDFDWTAKIQTEIK